LLHPGAVAEEQERQPAHAVAWLEAEEEQGPTESARSEVEASTAQPDAPPPPADAVPESAQDGAETIARPRGLTRRTLAFLNANGLARASLLAVLVVAVGIGAAAWLEDRITSRQEVLENTRFVREVALDPQARALPFADLRLTGAQLAGLALGCRPGPADNCADLSGADLSGANLSGADLSGADLSNADLADTDLAEAALNAAVLYDANLSSADLSEADLRGANLIRADLSDADLSGTDLSSATLLLADLTGADLRYASPSGANLTDANLTGADLSGANLTDADLSSADLTDADVAGANLSGVRADEDTRWPDGFAPPG
jgi:uncharacterized protein YjbI with pentapeptide repeats